MAIQSNFPNLKPTLLLDFANTETLDPRVTFTRGSTATYYDGKTTVMAEHNTVLYSQDFTNSNWEFASQNSVLVANSITAPDGTVTASTVSNNSTGGIHRFYQSLPSFSKQTAYTFSVYLKYKDHQYVSIGLTDNSYYRSQVVVNLVAGTITQNFTDSSFSPSDRLTSTITSVGNGWYRVTGTFTPGAAIVGNLYWLGILQQGSGFSTDGYVGTGTGFYMWGIQAEQRSFAGAYIPTTSQPVTTYIPQLLTAGTNQPRFEHNPITGESLGLLVEEQRTNLLLYSSDLSNAYWTTSGNAINLISNTIVAPDGTLTGDKISAANTTAQHYSYPASGTVVSAGTYTASIYAKAGEQTRLVSGIWGGSDYAMAQFDLTNGTILQEATAGMASITSVGNGWYRCTVTRTIGATTTYFSFGPNINANLTSTTGFFPSYTGNGLNGIYIWGAQLETAAFATSYIATTSATVTRIADDANITGANLTSWFQPQQGSLYFESSYLKSGTRSPFQIGSGFYSRYGFYTSDSTLGYFDGTVPFNTSLPSTSNKIACSLVNNDIAVAINNNSTLTSGGKALINADKFTIGGSWYGGEYICGTIKKIAYYPARLSNTQLQALTT
jgi:hypothetical protein